MRQLLATFMCPCVCVIYDMDALTVGGICQGVFTQYVCNATPYGAIYRHVDQLVERVDLSAPIQEPTVRFTPR